jgi:hypothetical protein
LVTGWIAENRLATTYKYKENKGKPSVNGGFSFARGELTIILDSDDHLSNNAVETIKMNWIN